MADISGNVNQTVWLLSGQVTEGDSVRDIPVTATPFQIGRRAGLSLQIPSPTVSNVHAEIVECPEGLALRDLGSTNGTFINGQRVPGETPLHEGDLIQFANVVFRLKRQCEVTGVETLQGDSCDRAMALIQFDRLLSERAIIPYFQPIVRAENGDVIGFEVLGRSPLFGLKTPGLMFQAAAQLNLEAELSRLCRWLGVEKGLSLPGSPALFLNTHPAEMADIHVLELSLQELREAFPSPAITLEIHETTVTNPAVMSALRESLTALNINMAYDDFGAGQARLIELVEVPPDVLKFDIKMIKGIDRASTQRQNMLACLVRMVRDMGIQPLAEGMESEREAQVCVDLGFDLSQGFYYGEPLPAATIGARLSY